MRVVHFSDWHGNLGRLLPPADLYVCTGDMLPNFPIIKFENPFAPDKEHQFVWWDSTGIEPGTTSNRPRYMTYCGRRLVPAREGTLQADWATKLMSKHGGSLRNLMFSTRDAPVVTCRGNHDWINLAPLFGGDAWEVGERGDEVTTINGLKVGGVRGVNWMAGEWADELEQDQFEERAKRLPGDLDVLVTHSPPWGILDWFGTSGGNPSLREYIRDRADTLKLHCFGHIHEDHGTQRVGGGTWFSNAATRHMVVDL